MPLSGLSGFADRLFADRWFRVFCYIMAAVYTLGTLVHLASIAGLTGGNWLEKPRKWQLLDEFYMLLDACVAGGLLLRRWWGIAALILAAGSQILLYTELRDWILDVPEAFAPSAGELWFLDQLVMFHFASLAVLAVFCWRHRN